MNSPSLAELFPNGVEAPQQNSALQYKPCITSRGPSPSKIMLLGEAPGRKEEELGMPFVGSSGQLLDQLLMEAGLNPGSIFMTNVFQTRPTNNQLQTLFMSNDEWKAFQKIGMSGRSGSAPSSGTDTLTSIPPMKIDGKLYHLSPAFRKELERLEKEIDQCQPNVIVALGNTALWSLTGQQNISSLRGTTLLSSRLSTQRKLLPTFHPAAVLRAWNLRTIVLADLMKAKVQAEYPEVRRPSREILLNPTLIDLENFLRQGLTSAKALAVDVETRNGQITEIGFAPSASFALVVPFIKGYRDHYWSTPTQEATALRYVRAILSHPVPKIFQNGLYDIQYIMRTWGVAPRNCLHDTMIKHHALYPELQKGLGFLGSIYTEEPAWKIMRNKRDKEKADDE